MIKSNQHRNLFAAVPMLLFALAIGVAPGCSSTDEDESAQSEIQDEADFDPSDGAG